jgi:hypothetical protein
MHGYSTSSSNSHVHSSFVIELVLQISLVTCATIATSD